VETAIPPQLETLPSTTLWNTASGLQNLSLPDNHHLIFNPVGVGGVVVLNSSAHALLQRYQRPLPLEGEYASHLAALQLLQPYAPEYQPAVHCFPQPTALTAWLHITNACNLRCTYCYLNKTNEAMDVETGKAAVDMLFRQAQARGYDTVKLKYSGGESTLNFDLIRTLHHYAHGLSQRTGITLQEVVLSNGVRISDDMLDFLQYNDIHLSISLDGIGSEHDIQRPFIGGGSTSKLVQKTIDRAIDYGIRPHITITVTANNAHALAKVVAFALERGLYFNLNFYQEHLPNQAYSSLRAINQRIIVGLKEALTVIEQQLPPYDLFSTLIDRASFTAPHTQTCGAGDNYVVIDHNGQIARCHMEIEHPVSNIWAQDPLADIRFVNNNQGFINVPVDEKEECSTCQWRYWCTGGCSFVTYRVTGQSNAKSPYCDVYRAIFPEILRLEGLRLMKWQNLC
jgi:uncharacterized protein